MSCTSCGNDMRLSTDEALKYRWDTTEDIVCWACVIRDIRRRVLGKKAETDDKKAGDAKPHFFDGREIYVTLLDPAEKPVE